MRLIILVAFVAVASAGRLENTYLPPLSAGSAAGSRFLAAPARTATVLTPSHIRVVPAATTQRFAGSASAPIPILKLDNDNTGDGSYKFSFETANHIIQQESGHQKGEDSSEVHGSYSYTGDDGQTYTITYVADENGYRAEGAHIPIAPPIDAEILKGLQQNAADEAAGIFDDGQYRPSEHGEASGKYTGSSVSSTKISGQFLAPPRHGGYKY